MSYTVKFPNGRSIEVSSAEEAIMIADGNVAGVASTVNYIRSSDERLGQLEDLIFLMEPGHKFDREWARDVVGSRSKTVGLLLSRLMNAKVLTGDTHTGKYCRTDLRVNPER